MSSSLAEVQVNLCDIFNRRAHRPFADEMGLDDMENHLADRTSPSNDEAFIPVLVSDIEFRDLSVLLPPALSSHSSNLQTPFPAPTTRTNYCNLCKHISKSEGTTHRYPNELFHLIVEPNVSLHCSREYPVPHSLWHFQGRIWSPRFLGILDPQGLSKWISGNFHIPRHDRSMESKQCLPHSSRTSFLAGLNTPSSVSLAFQCNTIPWKWMIKARIFALSPLSSVCIVSSVSPCVSVSHEILLKRSSNDCFELLKALKNT